MKVKSASEKSVSIALLCAVFLIVAVRAAFAAHFFPTPGPNAKTFVLYGTIIDYGVGADSGGFDVATGEGETINSAVGANMMINGKLVQCQTPAHCANWPPNIVMGKSKVRVLYWGTNLHGYPIKASRQIDSVR